MTVNDWLQDAVQKLEKANVGTARLDALVLLADLLNKNTAQVLAAPERELSVEQTNVLKNQLERRVKHEPLAYIRGHCEFYGREFVVRETVLVPRPETETMIDLAKKLRPKAVVDVGTGSGAIAITMACELGAVQVLATDVDAACLKVARKNCVKHQATVDLIETDLVQGVRLPPNAVILANLPYVPNDHTINQAAMTEPSQAIFGGPDGLDLYGKLFDQLEGHHHGYVLTESLPPQHTQLTKIASQHGYSLVQADDFIQVFSSVELRQASRSE